MNNANPTYSDIVALLNTLVPTTDPNIESAPHLAFWRTMSRDEFVNKDTSDWGVSGPLVALNNPNGSNFFLALSGKAPFDGSELPQMPDTNADPNARTATQDELNLVETWISNGAPA